MDPSTGSTGAAENPSYPRPQGPPPSATHGQRQSNGTDVHFNDPFVQQDPPISRIPLAPPSGHREQRDSDDYYSRFSLSSYKHPHEIPPPQDTYTPNPNDQPRPLRSALRRSVSFAQDPGVKEYDPEGHEHEDEKIDPFDDRYQKRRGIPSQMMQLNALNREIEMEQQQQQHTDRVPKPSFSSSEHRTPKSSLSNSEYSFQRPNYRRLDSTASTGSEYLDEYDPRVTGIRAEHVDDHEDLERNTLRQMDYRQRRKHLMRVRIEFNIVSMAHRQEFLLKLARALMTFGAPSHRIESQLVAAGRILEVEAEIIHLPSVIICSFGDQELGCSETHFVRCGGRLALGALHKVHLIYRAVVHDEISAKKAAQQLEDLLNAPPLYPASFRCILAFCLSALICPLAFGGSFLDMWVAGAGALILSVLQLCATKSALYANVFEITVAIFVSFAARGLSSIRTQIFCYTAISSSAIIGILPGYLILSSSLELASKNIVCGSVKMVYALIYTLFLGFGLQIGSDFYLLFDRSMRRRLDDLASSLEKTVSLTGTWVSDNATTNASAPMVGIWTFSRAVALKSQDIHEGCYRPHSFPWYLQPFPEWPAFIIVPVFSLLSSLANLQPLKSKQLPVMVIISCCSYASNKVANHYIFNRSDVVSAIGAFTVGVLGNVYSRKMGGTAFTSMVTGVLFLVPSGLSQAGGITANGNGIDIGGAMIAVTIGITVGLFMSQALVYMFGTRKNAAVFSF
ncbi:pheromone-regulated protein prm10 [Marasmius sp. AFHP31]|nr:pheromone-regulated protein prm10 [Marasmius sp. AFHP31]